MAKNKDKSAKPAASSDDFAKPSEAPAGGDGWSFASDENKGKLFLITPLRTDEVDDTYHPGQRKEIVVADIVELNEKKPAKSEEHTNVFVFQGYLKGALRGYVGERKVLGRLYQSKEADRGNFPWMLADANADDIEVAKEYLASIDPFATKGAEPEAKKAKKSKPEPVAEAPAKKKKAKK